MASKASKKRTDSRRRVLKTGESQRKNGSYSYRWTDEHGVRHDVYAPTLEALREKEQAIRTAPIGKAPFGRTPTLDGLYALWRSLKQNIRQSSQDSYASLYENHIRPSLGHCRLCEIKSSQVQLFYQGLLMREGLSPNTVLSVHNVLHQILEVGVRDGYLLTNPCHRALAQIKKQARLKQPQRRALTAEQQRRFLSFLSTDKAFRRYYPAFLVLLGTGMRAGELGALQWSDIDWVSGCIHIRHTLSCCKDVSSGSWQLHLHPPKTPSGCRSIYMIPAVRRALLEERAYAQPCVRCVDGCADFVFLTRQGGPRTDCNLNEALRRILSACNREALTHQPPLMPLPDFTCHILRHSFATRLCELGVNIKVVQEAMGHADASMTLNTYMDVKEELRAQEMHLLEHCFPEKQGSFCED